MQRITILGSTGSIGTQSLAVLAQHGEQFQIRALAAHKNVDLLFQQCKQFQPQYAALVNHQSAQQLKKLLHDAKLTTEVLAGEEALVDLARDPACDVVMAAIVGAAGLRSTFAAVQSKKRVLLANKESLVMAGHLLTAEVQRQDAILLPVDSEHSAILQCLPTAFRPIISKLDTVDSIILTASGGIFRDWPINELKNATPQLAITHPNWNMGAKITVDCATMMNKGFEVIETFWFFGTSCSQIEVVVHPQSIIHSLVQFKDGSSMAQLGLPDMRMPISYALAWPQRIVSGVTPLNLLQNKALNFFEIDMNRYPCFKIARSALKAGNSACAIMNAANEVAVQAFLEQKIRYTEIAPLIETVLDRSSNPVANDLDQILSIDQMARQYAVESMMSYA